MAWQHTRVLGTTPSSDDSYRIKYYTRVEVHRAMSLPAAWSWEGRSVQLWRKACTPPFSVTDRRRDH
jgi:hypothetical protein